MPDYAFEARSSFVVDKRKYTGHKSYLYKAKCLPVVQLYMRRTDGLLSRKIPLLADTGASVSTLSASTADKLKINRWPKQNERLKHYVGPGGFPLVGLLRHISVQFGGRNHTIEVLVPSKVDKDGEGRFVVGGKPESDVLGSGILKSYLLCFNSHTLYAFRRRGG